MEYMMYVYIYTTCDSNGYFPCVPLGVIVQDVGYMMYICIYTTCDSNGYFPCVPLGVIVQDVEYMMYICIYTANQFDLSVFNRRCHQNTHLCLCTFQTGLL